MAKSQTKTADLNGQDNENLSKKSKPKKSKTPADGTPTIIELLPTVPTVNVAAFQKFTVKRVHRSMLKKAPYNPRIIDDMAKQRLKENLADVGLLETIVWNERTGNLVAGHQRLGQIDSLMGTPDYYLDVAAVDLDDQTEREQNIFMNNAESQGTWDMEKLGEMVKKKEVKIEKTGFTTATLAQMFGDAAFVNNSQALAGIADRLRETWKQYEQLSDVRQSERDVDFYLIAIFSDSHHRAEFLTACGLPDDNCYVDGRVLQAMLSPKKDPEGQSAK